MDAEKLNTQGYFPESCGAGYAHGSYAGWGLKLLMDPHGRTVFEELMPSAFDGAMRSISPSFVLPNNPVVAAFGLLEQPRCTELDVWLSPSEPSSICAARAVHGGGICIFLQNALPNSSFAWEFKEIQNAPSVVEWFDIFKKALSLFLAGPRLMSKPNTRAREQDKITRQHATSAAFRFPHHTEGGGVMIDIKSTYSKASDVAAFICSLESYGVDVVSVGSFYYEQLVQLPGHIRPILHTNGLAGATLALRKAHIRNNSRLDISLNAASLIRSVKVGSGQKVEIDSHRLNTLFELLELRPLGQLHFFLYIQEGAAEPQVMRLISELAAAHPQVLTHCTSLPADSNYEAKPEGTGWGLQWWADWLDRTALMTSDLI